MTTKIESDWYENGQKKSEGNYKDGNREGLWTVWFENGQKNRETNFKGGKGDGLVTGWYEDGQKELEGSYKGGKLEGLFITWYENGQKEFEGNFNDGKLEGLWTGCNEEGNVIKNETYTEHSFNIILKDEDYTIGKIIEFIIFSKFVEHDKKCNFVSFKKTHPHDSDSLIILSYVESIEIPDILADLNIIFNDSIKILETILSQIP
jgi:antitoxin component YwqK of YwqJK toxin-antitoxin module